MIPSLIAAFVVALISGGLLHKIVQSTDARSNGRGCGLLVWIVLTYLALVPIITLGFGPHFAEWLLSVPSKKD